jgi:hypothetical protein
LSHSTSPICLFAFVFCFCLCLAFITIFHLKVLWKNLVGCPRKDEKQPCSHPGPDSCNSKRCDSLLGPTN